MNSLIEFFDGPTAAAWVLALSFKGSVIIGLVLVIQRLAGRWLSAQARYWLWMPALFCLFVPFGVETAWSPFGSLPASSTPVTIVGEHAAAQTAPTSVGVDYASIWAFSAAALAGMVLLNAFRYARVQAKAQPTHDASDKLLDRCKGRLRIRRRVRVLETREVDAPTLFGWMRPTILLPAGLARELDNDELQHVFLHELTHVKRHDIALSWLMTFVQILHWFNPVVWYGFHRMRRDREFACDARVLRHLRPAERRAYGHTLISLMERNPRAMQFSQGLGIVGNTKPMKERLQMIKRYETVRKRHVVAGVLALLVVFALAFSENRTRAQEESTHAIVWEHDEAEHREGVRVEGTDHDGEHAESGGHQEERHEEGEHADGKRHEHERHAKAALEQALLLEAKARAEFDKLRTTKREVLLLEAEARKELDETSAAVQQVLRAEAEASDRLEQAKAAMKMELEKRKTQRARAGTPEHDSKSNISKTDIDERERHERKLKKENNALRKQQLARTEALKDEARKSELKARKEQEKAKTVKKAPMESSSSQKMKRKEGEARLKMQGIKKKKSNQ